MPRVSIIVPAYNSAATVGRAVDGVLGQTYSDWELIVADDRSSDDTVALLERYGDTLTVVRCAENLGPAGARNAALEHATGELVAFLDADDWWLPRYLERQVGAFDSAAANGARVGVVACDALIASPDGERFEDGTYHDMFRSVEPVTVARLLRRNFLFVSCLVPRDAGEEVGWFDPSLFGTEDHDLWLKILETGRTCLLLRQPLAVYRRTSSSISRDTARQARNNQKTIRKALDRGRLTRREARIARSELRYNRALEAVAGLAFDGRRPAARVLPELAWVAITRPRHWGDWLTALRAR